jgi:hypothetical protein
LFLFATSSVAQGQIFGPKRYTRTTGAPQTFTETFGRCGGDPCQLVVVNGDTDGTNRVSAATISLNGVVLLGPRDFNQRVTRLVVPVTLADNDQLIIRIASAPESFLTISVECASTANLSIAQPPGVVSSIWQDGTVALSIQSQPAGQRAWPSNSNVMPLRGTNTARP